MKKLFVVRGTPIAFWFVGGRSADYPYDQTLLVLRDLFAMLEQKELLIANRLSCFDAELRVHREIPITLPFEPSRLTYWAAMVEQASNYSGDKLFYTDITMRGKTLLYEDQKACWYDNAFEVRFSIEGFPRFWINLYATHFVPYYLDASAPNPYFNSNYQRFRGFVDELTSKYPDLEVVLEDDYSPYAKMEGLEIKNLTYGDDGSMISIEIHGD